MKRVLPFLLLPFGCATTGPSTTSTAGAAAAGPGASASVEARSDSTLQGSARFSSVSGGLGVHLEVTHATPGLHGVHVHEKGDCSDPKATSAGPHFSPGAGAHHGGPATAMRHGGDLGNLEVDATGKGVLDVVVAGLSLEDPATGVVGRAIVVHEKGDDLATDPSGNSGARIGCGVIRAAAVP